jgi:hypothetical protein
VIIVVLDMVILCLRGFRSIWVSLINSISLLLILILLDNKQPFYTTPDLIQITRMEKLSNKHKTIAMVIEYCKNVKFIFLGIET